MARSAALRFWTECPGCKTKIVLPEWSETIGEHETINFWCCPVCEKEFETTESVLMTDCGLLQPQTDAELEESLLPHLLVA